MKRGEIYYIKHRTTMGSEIAGDRPAVIVSNNVLNETSTVLEVVFLTTKPKKHLPTHATIYATGVKSTALCEQVYSVSDALVGDYCATCNEAEMAELDDALRASLGLYGPAPEPAYHIDREEYLAVCVERDTYKRILDSLLHGKGVTR